MQNIVLIGTLLQWPDGWLLKKWSFRGWRKSAPGSSLEVCKCSMSWTPQHWKLPSRQWVVTAFGRTAPGVLLRPSKRPKQRPGTTPEEKIGQVSTLFKVWSFPLLEWPQTASQICPIGMGPTWAARGHCGAGPKGLSVQAVRECF